LNYSEIATLATVLAVSSLAAVIVAKPMNAWLLGDNYATSLGINTWACRLVMILIACALTGAVTAFCGPIAFVGLAVPHFTRLIFRTHDHLTLLPAVSVCGAILMLCCDILAQLPGTAYVLPINAVTALIGAPAVISIILRARQIAV
jgi:iron complex transport system permease protein